MDRLYLTTVIIVHIQIKLSLHRINIKKGKNYQKK